MLVGIITFTLPVLVWATASFARLPSISASYYTRAQDLFVGLLFVLGAFLLVYKGHREYPMQDWAANLGALAAVIAALFPTSCNAALCPACGHDFCKANPTYCDATLCQDDLASTIHLTAGIALFLVAAYFCFGPFAKAAKDKDWIEAKRRVVAYYILGSAIILCLVTVGILKLTMTGIQKDACRPIFWGEFAMLWLFSAAWMVAAKRIPGLVNKDERRKL